MRVPRERQCRGRGSLRCLCRGNFGRGVVNDDPRVFKEIGVDGFRALLDCQPMRHTIAIQRVTTVWPERLVFGGVKATWVARARIIASITGIGTYMSAKNPAKSPATMQDVFDGTEAALGFAGAVMARVIPIFVRYPLVSAENFEALQKELEALAAEYERTSPYSVIVMDTLLHTLEVDRKRIFVEPGKAT